MMVVVILDDNKVFFRNDEVFPVHLVQDVGLEDFGWRTGCEKSRLEQHEAIDPRTNHINVVCDQENG